MSLVLAYSMNYWIFQATPERYDLRSELKEEKTESWYATRYRSDMHVGDLVFFWLSGPPEIRGIYGWGTLTSEPYLIEERDSHFVDVEYETRLKEHIPVKQIKSTAALSDLLILRAPQATNFLLSETEAEAIIGLMKPGERPNGGVTDG